MTLLSTLSGILSVTNIDGYQLLRVDKLFYFSMMQIQTEIGEVDLDVNFAAGKVRVHETAQGCYG
jgi:hypothetical protein